MIMSILAHSIKRYRWITVHTCLQRGDTLCLESSEPCLTIFWSMKRFNNSNYWQCPCQSIVVDTTTSFAMHVVQWNGRVPNTATCCNKQGWPGCWLVMTVVRARQVPWLAHLISLDSGTRFATSHQDWGQAHLLQAVLWGPLAQTMLWVLSCLCIHH